MKVSFRLMLLLSALSTLAVDNPFLRVDSLNDCGVYKFNGEYYITGNWLAGHMYSSRDLVNWGNRRKVITNVGQWTTENDGDDLQIHASDLNYFNGIFHLYFQVGTQIGHATAQSPWGQYLEPDPTRPFSGRIDPHYFRDEDGSHYFYTVKFSNGNLIFGQPMADPNTLSGSATQLLSVVPGTWENSRGTTINEGPFVFKYRHRYYMLYNGNDTGNPDYQIGCVEAATPLGFRNAGKYPQPVLPRTSVGGGQIHTIGQPWVVEGPNGFEKWVGYFSIHTPDSPDQRFQCVDRLYFFDRKLVADGPTTRFTPGYHPDPAKPTLLSLFHVPDGPLPNRDWSLATGGEWQVRSQEAWQTNQNSWSLNLVNRDPAQHYLIEANFRFNEAMDSEDKAGVLAYYQNSANWMIVGVDRVAGNWYVHQHENGRDSISAGALWPGWDHRVYHKIRVQRNGERFDVRLDGMIPQHSSGSFLTSFTAPGRPGIYTDHSSASFDGVIYTIGWDECDGDVRGWSASVEDGWRIGNAGLEQTIPAGLRRAFKGDLMPEYQVQTHVYRTSPVRNDGTRQSIGFIPVIVDANNYLAAEIDLNSSRMLISGLQGGIPMETVSHPIAVGDNFNLRAAKLADRVILFVDGKELTSISASFGPSRVGLVTENTTARFNGILVYRTEPAALPSFWQNADIGTISFPGSATQTEGTIVINGSGEDIWDRRDGGHFAYQRLTGNGSIVARLDSIDPTDYWAKAGLMFRENLSSTARMVYLCMNAATDGNGDQHQLIWRSAPGAGTGIHVHEQNPVLPAQGWLRLVRQGNSFTGFYSTNGIAWRSLGSCEVPLPATVLVGLAVTSHNTNRVSGAVFDNVVIKPAATTISIEVDRSAEVTYGEPVRLTAEVSAAEGTPNGTVTFRISGANLGSANLAAQGASSATASITVAKLPSGTHQLSAHFGGTADFARSDSAPLSIMVQRRMVRLDGIAVADKIYDGSQQGELSGTPALSGVIQGDQVSLAGTPIVTFADSSVGQGKSVNVTGYNLEGPASIHYSLAPAETLRADILPLPLRLQGAKVYDGSREIPASLLLIENNKDGEALTISGVGLLTEPHAGSQELMAGTLTISGPASPNYTLSGSPGSVLVTPASATLRLSQNAETSANGSGVVFTAEVITNSWIAGGISGFVRFTRNGVPVGEFPIGADARTSFIPESLPHGSNRVVAEYLGLPNILSEPAPLTHVVNNPPVARHLAFATARNTPLSFPALSGPNAVLDPDLDPLSITSIGNPAHGHTATDGTNILYTPNLDFVGADAFEFTVTDPFGARAIASVAVEVKASDPTISLVITRVGERALRFQWNAEPGQSYTLQFLTDLSSANWADLAQVVATGEAVEYSEGLSVEKSRFFRVQKTNALPQ